MLKVYGTELCPDCVECKYNLDKNNNSSKAKASKWFTQEKLVKAVD